MLKYFRCNRLCHIAKHFYTMRFYSCDVFGHKDQLYQRTVNGLDRNILHNINHNTRAKREYNKGKYQNESLYMNKWVRKTPQTCT